MKRTITTIIGALALAASCALVTPTPASADVSNPYAAWACGGSRPNSHYILTDADPRNLTPQWLWSWCTATVGNGPCSWGVYLFSNGDIFRNTAYVGSGCP